MNYRYQQHKIMASQLYNICNSHLQKRRKYRTLTDSRDREYKRWSVIPKKIEKTSIVITKNYVKNSQRGDDGMFYLDIIYSHGSSYRCSIAGTVQNDSEFMQYCFERKPELCEK